MSSINFSALNRNYYNFSSSLFGNNSNSSGNSDLFGSMYDNLSTFNSIKSGLYTKLAKKNYAKAASKAQETTNSNNPVKTTEKTVTKTQYLDVQDDASDLASSVNTIKSKINKLKSYGDDATNSYSEDKISKAETELVNAAQKFVDNYNSLVDSTSKVSTSSITSNEKLITNSSSLNYNKNLLSNIGIEVSADNKLTINKDKMMQSDLDDFDKLFTYNGGYGDNIIAKASQISSYATSEATNFSSTSSYSVSGSYNSSYMIGSLLNGYV